MNNKNLSDDNKYDVIIIGSGIGGLVAGGILAKMNKKRILILEKHYEIGGLTHEFKRGPYSWDVGLHYLGTDFMDGLAHYILGYITDNNLKFNKMPHIFEKYIYPDFTINVSENKKEYIKELHKYFPDEKIRLKKY